MKICRKCNVEKEEKHFSKNKDECKSCAAKMFRVWWEKSKLLPKPEIDLTKSKMCSVCKEKKPIIEFYIRSDRNKPIGRCKKCNELANKKSWNKLPEEEKKKRYAENKRWVDTQINNGNLRIYMTSKLCSYKATAKKWGLPFDLDISYLVELMEKQKRLCHYTGEPLTMQSNRGSGKCCITLPSNRMQASLDRLDPDKGYVKGNVVWCGWLINTCKNMLTESQFYDMCKNILAHRRIV